MNRTIRWGDQGIEIESGSRHVEEIILGLGLEFGRAVANPIITDKDAKKLVGGEGWRWESFKGEPLGMHREQWFEDIMSEGGPEFEGPGGER